MKSTIIVALDQHAATTVAAVLLPGQRLAALHSLTSDSATVLRFLERVRRQGPVRCCHEAGPCGFELQRALSAHDIPCEVIAPALIPRRPGDRVKTDRRDASQFAIWYRAGALTAIHIPTDQEEAARDLLRCREDIRTDLLRARHRLSKFLLRHGRRFTATKTAWSKRMRPGCEHKHGRCRRWTRRIARTCAPSRKRWRVSGTLRRICARCSRLSHCARASNACGASAASTT
ncbi:MAG: transposase [Acidobacteria bacterium]|nr:transposase [Acidobacteriota bacterium]